MPSASRKERKVVTVVFADLVGFTARAETLDPEDVEAILSPYHARLRGELERFGGTVEKFTRAARGRSTRYVAEAEALLSTATEATAQPG